MARPISHESPFDTLEAVFGVACAGPSPLAIDGRDVPGLPRRSVTLVELRAILLHPATSHATRDAALALLLARARGEGGTWTIGLAGVLLFGLRRAVGVLCEVCPGKSVDIEAEALTGLIEGIAATEPTRRRLAARLTWLARNRAKRLVEHELGEAAPPEHDPVPAAPVCPYGHPDLVLAKAVAEGVLCPEDAALIGETRLGLMSMKEAAERLGIDLWAARKRRRRSELALRAWIEGPDYEPGFVQERPKTPYLQGGGRPRLGRDIDRRPAACQPPTTPRR